MVFWRPWLSNWLQARVVVRPIRVLCKPVLFPRFWANCQKIHWSLSNKNMLFHEKGADLHFLPEQVYISVYMNTFRSSFHGSIFSTVMIFFRLRRSSFVPEEPDELDDIADMWRWAGGSRLTKVTWTFFFEGGTSGSGNFYHFCSCILLMGWMCFSFPGPCVLNSSCGFRY